MSYSPTTDFLALLRAGTPNSLAKAPALDIIVSALARANVINLHVGLSAPTSQQPVTAWLKTQSPSYSAEGALWLWDSVAGAYAVATPYLFGRMVATASGLPSATIQTGSGDPLNTVGANGDFYVDTTSGNYWGPKAAGVWPIIPLIYGVKATSGPNLLIGNSGGSAPSSTVGQNGQYFEDLTTGNIYGPKAAGAWPVAPVYNSPSQLPVNIVLFGKTAGAAPLNSVGSDGQYFEDLDSGNVYGPKAAGAWPATPTLYGNTRKVLPASLASTEITQNKAYSRTFTTEGLTAPVTWSVSAGALPSGLNLNSATGAVTGTPVASGAYSFTLAATDTAGVVARTSYAGNVNAALSLAITPVSLGTLIVGRALALQISASNGTGPWVYALTAGALPAGLKLDSTTGIIVGSPTTAGAYSFTITTTDANSNLGSQAFSGNVGASSTEFADATTSGIAVNTPTAVTIGASSTADFTVAGATITCVTPGDYLLTGGAHLQVTNGSANAGTQNIETRKNGAAIGIVNGPQGATAAGWVTNSQFSFAYKVALAVGDTLQLVATASYPGGASAISAGTTSLSLTRIK